MNERQGMKFPVKVFLPSVLFVLAFAWTVAAQTPTKAPSQVGRYQIVPVEYERVHISDKTEIERAKGVIKIDTVTGDTWILADLEITDEITSAGKVKHAYERVWGKVEAKSETVIDKEIVIDPKLGPYTPGGIRYK